LLWKCFCSITDVTETGRVVRDGRMVKTWRLLDSYPAEEAGAGCNLLSFVSFIEEEVAI
jgi:hypothetical protein